MKLYSVLVKKNQSGGFDDVVLLKEGFSFFALLFSDLWLFYHKMWREFFVLILANFFLATSFQNISGFDKFFLELALVIIVALNANYWLCEHLKKRGYEFMGLVFGHDIAHARIRFLKNSRVSQE